MKHVESDHECLHWVDGLNYEKNQNKWKIDLKYNVKRNSKLE